MRLISGTVLRAVILATTLIATLIMVTAKQTKTIEIQVASTLPPLLSPKFTYFSAFIYFIVVNSIGFVYTALSMVSQFMSKKSVKAMKVILMVVSIMNLMMVALLFSGAGGAMNFGLLSQYGNSHVRWNKVRPVFSKFCTHVKAAIAVSMVGACAPHLHFRPS